MKNSFKITDNRHDLVQYCSQYCVARLCGAERSHNIYKHSDGENPLSLKSPAPRLFAQPFVQVQIKENIKVPRPWPLWGDYIGDRWIP